MRTTNVRPLGLWSRILVACAAVMWAGAAEATLPVARLYSVFPAGAKQGTTLDVTITGADLEDASKLLFSDPAITAVQKTAPPGLGENGPQPVDGQFKLTIGPEAKPGLCEVRAIGKYGISNPRMFVVGTQPEITETEPNNGADTAKAVALGTIVNGQSNAAADQDFYKIELKKGQRVLVDCWSYRIDSRMDATLVLYDAQGKELDRNRDTNRRDPLLDFVAPADGTYYVEVHDFLYAGSSDYFYRLNIGAEPYLDFVFPPSGQPGTTGKYTLYGRNLPGGQASPLKAADGKPLESLTVDIALPADGSLQTLETGSVVEPDESGMDALTYRLPTATGLSSAVVLGFAAAPVVTEQEPNDDPAKAQAITTPCEFVGQFYPQADRDWVIFQAKAGEALWIEVTSQRLGLPVDPSLVVQQVTKNDKGEEQIKEIQAVDDFLENPRGPAGSAYDMKTDDPAFRFVAPADGTYRILIRNLANYSHPDPRFVYRLAIHPAQPDFRLVVKPQLIPFSPDVNQNPPTVWSPLLRKGGSELIDVMVFRRDGFDGEVKVSLEGLPAGVTASEVTIAAGQNLGAVVLSAAENAAEATALVNVVGKAKVGDTEIVRPGRAATMVWGGAVNQVTPRSRLTRNLAVAVSGLETAQYFVDAGQNAVLEMCKAGKVQVPVKLTRRGEFKGNVVLAPNPLPPNVKPATITLDANAAEGKLEINLPANTPAGTYSFSILGTSQISYARNPEAIKAATERKAAVDKIVGELAAAAKASADAKAAAEKKSADMSVAMQKAREAVVAADKAAQEATAKAKAAVEAKAAAEKAAAEAEALAKTAADAKAAADKAAAALEADVKAAADAKAAAEKQAADAEAKAKEAAAVQTAVAKAVTDATNRAKPANINLAVPSPTVTLKVTDAPVTIDPQPAPAVAKAGTKHELTVSIKRLYGFADVVTLKPKLATDVKGIKLADATIAPAESAGKIALDIAADVPPGTYTVNVAAVAKFNGQDLSVTIPVPVTIEAK